MATIEEYKEAQEKIAEYRKALAVIPQITEFTEDAYSSSVKVLRSNIRKGIHRLRANVQSNRPSPRPFLPTRLTKSLPSDYSGLKAGPFRVDMRQDELLYDEPVCRFRDNNRDDRILEPGYSIEGVAKIKFDIESRNTSNYLDWRGCVVPVGFLAHLKANRVAFTDENGWGFALLHKRHPTNKIDTKVWLVAGRGGNNRVFKKRYMTQLIDGSVLVRKTFKALQEAYVEQITAHLSEELGIDIGGERHYREVSYD